MQAIRTLGRLPKENRKGPKEEQQLAEKLRKARRAGKLSREEEEELRGALAAADGVEADCGLGEGKVRAWLGSSDAGGSKALRASDNSLQSESTGVGMNGIVWADDVGRELVDRRRLAAPVCATQKHSHPATSPPHPARCVRMVFVSV